MATLTADRKHALRRELEGILGRGAVLSDPDELLTYESDGLTLFRALADFVVFPTSAEHVAAVVKLANREIEGLENLPGRPLFEPLTAVAFVVGLTLAAFALAARAGPIRRARYLGAITGVLG